jgi:hypothetical protein
VGVCLFIALYTAATSTPAFERFHQRPFVRRTLYIGYGARLFLSMLMPLGLPVRGPEILFLAPDLWPGLLSVNVVEAIGLNPPSFAGTLATTIVQGALLNVAIFLFMLVVYGAQRLLLPPPPEHSPRGFEPIMPVAQLPDRPATR